MQNSQALKIIQSLANGLDPLTGRELPPSTPFDQPAVIRALFAAARALETAPQAAPQTAPQTQHEVSNLASLQAPVAATPLPAEVPKSVASAPSTGWEIRPANAGKPWSREEDARLCQSFDRGVTSEVLAQLHARTQASIQSRLVKLGKMPEQAAPSSASTST